MSPIQQFRVALVVLASLLIVGTIGYAELWHVSLLDGLYMTVITLATVGYRELRPPSPAVKVFTILLILIGVAALAWAVRAATELAVGELFREVFGNRQLKHQIARMRNHTIICGFGRMGTQIAADLSHAKKAFVIVDPNPEAAERNKDFNYPFIQDDASSEMVLREAGIERASNLVAGAPTDADNVFIVLVARGLSPRLHIVARSTRPENENKLYRAGANRVMSPYTMGGHRMAAAILHPHAVDFLEIAMGAEDTEMELGSVEIAEGSSLSGQPLAEARFQEDFGVSVVALRREGIFGMAPDPNTRLLPGDVLIILGPTSQVEAIQDL